MKRKLLIVFVFLLLFTGTAMASSYITIEMTRSPFQYVIGEKTIDMEYYFNGKEKVPTSVNYGGTTYVPIRLVAETLGYEVKWDAKKQTAYLLQDSDMEPAIDPNEVTDDPTIDPPKIKQPTSSDADEQRREILSNSLIEDGEKFLGAKYLYGAPDMYDDDFSTSVFDCSSFTQYVFSLNQIKIPRSARAQYQWAKEQGDIIYDIDKLKVGDLVFTMTSKTVDLDGYKKIGHVGIYAGDGKMLHTYGEGGVRYSSITKGYWQKAYLGAVRVIR